MSDVPALTAPPPGWYPDRNEANLVRWWDGQQWTDHTKSTAPAAAAFEHPVTAAAFGTVTAAVTAPAVAPGWYPNNSDRSIHRWWDGSQWTTHTAPAGAVVPQPSVGSFGAEPVSSVHNTMATLALIMSLVSFAGLIFAPLLALSLAGIIMGGVALRRARRFAPGARRRGQAVAGIVVGAVSLIATVLLTISALVVYQQVHSTAGSQVGGQQSSPQTGGGTTTGSPGGVFFPSTIDELKGSITKSIVRQNSVVVTTVTCDAAASMVTGSVFECGVTVADGRWVPVRVNIQYPAETGMAFGLSFGPLLAHNAAAPIQNYTLDQLTQELTSNLSQAWRSQVVRTGCESTASTATGSNFHCTLTLSGDHTAVVLITMVQPGGFDVTVTQPPSTDPEPDPDLSSS